MSKRAPTPVAIRPCVVCGGAKPFPIGALCPDCDEVTATFTGEDWRRVERMTSDQADAFLLARKAAAQAPDPFMVPTCPVCAIPLRPDEADPTKGLCPSIHCPNKGLVLSRDQFAWLHQSVFNQSECPPWNGWEPIRVDT